MSRLIGCICAGLSALFFTVMDITSYVAGNMTHPLLFVFLDATLLMFISVVALLVTKPSLPKTYKEITRLTLSGLTAGVGSVLLLWAIAVGQPGDVVSIYFALPVFVLILDTIIYRTVPRPIYFVFSLFSMIGVVLVAQPQFLFRDDDDDQFVLSGLAIGLAISSGFFHACNAISVESLGEFRTSRFLILALTAFHMFMFSLLLCLVYNVFTIPKSSDEIVPLVFLGAFGSGAALLSLNFALLFEKPFIVTITLTMEVLFTFISQHFILGLDADFLSIIGSILIVTSCVGVALAKEINDDNDVDEHSDDDNEELALLDE